MLEQCNSLDRVIATAGGEYLFRGEMLRIETVPGGESVLDGSGVEEKNVYLLLSRYLDDQDVPCTFLQMVVALSCNLSCAYCFARGRSLHKPSEYMKNIDKPGIMSEQNARRAIDFLLGDSEAGGLAPSVNFYGGEPLLNYNAIKAAVAYGDEQAALQGRSIHWSLVTNGTLLTGASLDFFSDRKVLLTVSLDGPRALHNANRLYPDGTGTHAVVERHVHSYLEQHPEAKSRIRFIAVVTPKTLARLDEFMDYFEREFPGIFVSVALEAENASFADCACSLLCRFFADVRLWIRIGKPPSWGFALFDADDLWRLYNGRKRYFGDKTLRGIRHLDMHPSGEIYPSFYLFGRPDFSMGKVDRGVTGRRNVTRLFVERSVDSPSSKDCHGCWAKYLCGGGFFNSDFSRTGDLHERAADLCDDRRIIFEYILKKSIELIEDGIDRTVLEKYVLDVLRPRQSMD